MTLQRNSIGCCIRIEKFFVCFSVHLLLSRCRVLIQRANIKMISMGLDIELQDEVDEDNAPADIPAIEDLPDEVSEIKKVRR